MRTAEQDQKIAQMVAAHAERLRDLMAEQEAEMTEKITEHARAMGALTANEEQAIAAAREGYDALLDNLNARIVTSDEILTKQQALIEKSSTIVENETNIAGLIAEESAKKEAALSDLRGTWSGTVNCYFGNKYNLWPVNFQAREISGNKISGSFVNEDYNNDSYIGLAVLTVESENLVPPVPMKLTLSKNAIVAMELALELSPEGLLVRESVEASQSGAKVCKDVQLRRAE